MKKIIIIAISFITFLPLFCFAGETVSPEQAESNQILAKFIDIEKNKAEFLIKSKRLRDETMMVSWSKAGSIRKIIIFTKSMLGTSEDHYYFSEQKLILCRSIIKNFKLESSGQLSDNSETQKHYLLYRSGELILPITAGAKNQNYISLGVEKRNALIANLSQLIN